MPEEKTIVINGDVIAIKMQKIFDTDPKLRTVFTNIVRYGKSFDEAKLIAKKRGINTLKNNYKDLIKFIKEYEYTHEGMMDAYEYLLNRSKNVNSNIQTKKTIEDKKREAEILIQQMHKPDITSKEMMILTGASQDIVDELMGGKIEINSRADRKSLININNQIMKAGKQMIFDKMTSMKVNSFGDLKAISDIMDTSFKQNRLLQGESTANVRVGIKELYDRIIDKATDER